nr:MSHA biogenesis protein MshI [Duganella flavida]
MFNPIFLKQKKFFTAVPMAEALGLIVAGALLLNWYAAQSVGELEKDAEAGKALLAKREQRLNQARVQFAPRAKDAALEAQVLAAEAELKALHDVSSVLQGGALGNTAGYAEYFRAFSRQNVSGLWLTGVSINGAGNDIGVQGRAMQATLIPNYIARLTGERIMRGKTFASLDIARPDAALPTAGAIAAAPTAAAAVASPFVEFNLQSTPQEAAK